MEADGGDPGPVALTGAGGFLGAAVLNAAAEAGVPVRAVLRPGGSLPGQPGGPGVDVRPVGLDDPAALEGVFRGCRAVIHAAAAMSATDAEHRERTVEPTRRAAEAAAAAGVRRFVLVSSLSVYDFEAAGRGGALTEATPRFGPATAGQLDAYARAKLAQEEAVEAVAARRPGALDPVFVRPGAIVGAGRRWTARLGFRKGPLAVRIGSGAPVPVIEAADCGRAVLRAATSLTPAPAPGSETSRGTSGEAGGGAVVGAGPAAARVFNLVGDHLPSQAAWLRAIRREEGLRVTVPVPLGPLLLAGRLLHPLLGSRLPGVLRPASARARFWPMAFPNARSREAGLL